MYFHYPTLGKILRESYFSKNAHPLHAAYVTLFLSLFFPARSLVSLGQFIDKIYYPQYQKQRVVAPLLITGNPRSGTTFLHRLLASDPQFTSTKLYHTIFPSVSFYRCFEAIDKFASNSEKTWGRWLEWLDKKSFGGWQGIHKTKLDGFEEDETIFVWTLLSPVITLLFPYPHRLHSTTWVEQLPPQTRHQLMDSYLDCLKRHLYATGSDKTLLIKNTTLTGRLAPMMEALPDLRIIHLIRHPYQAIPSLLSMYAVPWQKFAPQTRNNSNSYEALAQLYGEYYRRRMEIFQEMNQSESFRARLMEIPYENLIKDPLAIVKTIYQKFELEMSQDFQQQLEKQLQNHAKYKSSHQYSLEQFGLQREKLYEMMKDVFDFYGFDP